MQFLIHTGETDLVLLKKPHPLILQGQHCFGLMSCHTFVSNKQVSG